LCGLFGVIGKSIGKNEVACFRDLGLISSLRGLDSTGLIIVSKAKKNRWNIQYRKDATDSTNFLYYNKNVSQLLDKTQNVCAIMGHARAATVGTIIPENAHPFHVDKIVGMHNGTIMTLGTKDKTDSQHLYENISKMGVQKALDDIVGGAAYALTWVDSVKNEIKILRNYQRPLFCMLAKGNDLLYYASERKFLEIIAERSNRSFHDPHLIAEDTLFSIKFGSLDLEKEEVRRKFIPTAPVFPLKADGEIPLNKSVVPIGPPFIPSSIPDGPSIAVQNAVPAVTVEYETELEKFDPAHEVFPAKPHTGYPFKVQLRNPDLPTQFFKILRFNDFFGHYRAPNEISPLLDQGCIISGVKATLNDTVYWISPDLYVMPWLKDDPFVRECISVYDLKQPKMARACYASASALMKHKRNLDARAQEGNKVYVN